jgi:signal transduction histidine kinase
VRLAAVRNLLAGRAMDVVIIVVAVATLAELLTDGHPVPALLAAICLLVLLARRRAPAIAIVVSFAGQLARAATLGWHEPTGPFGMVLLTFVVAGGLRPEWAAWLGWACGLAAAATTEDIGGGGAASDILLTLAFCSALFGMALLVSRRTQAHHEMAERARHAEAEQARSAAEAVALERARIAREMHDVVAHSLTVAVVQCVAAGNDLDLGDSDAGSVRTRVRAAEGACREALDELRRLLGVLRFGPAELEPVPRLTALEGLCGAITGAGVRVDLELTGDLGALPPGVELSCYRIVQEALTNTLKHSGARHATVSVCGSGHDVTLRIQDDGHGQATRGPGSGQGLIGLRERAAAYGGTLSVGPSPSGGYLVEAVLPTGEQP